MNLFLRINDSSFVKYCAICQITKNLSLRNWCEIMRLDNECVCFNVSRLSLILDEIKLKIFFDVCVGGIVGKVKLLLERFYRLDLNFSSILIYFRDMIVI